ncbi:succinate dehydrogenase flavoprotein subunit [Leifsonia xyli subsp. cynodontis DSM 46306]|uniref:L-aspartate oxidase n=1 Tax=Leifsonia xyli subsp. cynodontis DSM 46306 TaxID=1389489 RepID=U3P6I0_LEIXC|nr:L-aspartate oxidase [Leifsonia xyli]AGW41920.1 succinate dehydrogenase flavoprotein subunit [Leifsonia xyli subsp. cynodontis DSM 46306]
MARVVVAGSGIAGLVAALRAAGRHRVTIVTKGALAESSTRYAQGGIAAALSPGDSAAAHIADTLRAGAGLSVPEAVAALCADGPERVRELLTLGVAFDREGGELARGLEAAHSHARVLHAGGDATGAEIERALVAAVRAARIPVIEGAFLREVLVADGRASGVLIRQADGSATTIAADAVLLATGGWGQLYGRTTNPAVATGDGVAAAWRAGAALADVEFTQFHPTALAGSGAAFLVSEAVRGEGAVLRNARGERFLREVHPDAELAPRDVVARGIAVEMAAQDGTPVVLDATMLGAKFLAQRFPTIDAACRAAGFDWSREPVPVTPAAHYAMGGVATDTAGRTTLPGLFTVGEAACTGAHGANRLASNSLLEGLVFAHRAAAAVDALDAGGDWPDPPAWLDGAGGGGALPESAPASPFNRARLQRVLWSAAGLSRTRTGLTRAAAELAGMRRPAPGEDANLLLLGRLVVAAALSREESRGAHSRSDFPLTAPGDARHTVLAPLPLPTEETVPC